jgi:hypothetical protein
MTTKDLKVGQKITDIRFNSEFYIISITEKRINCDSNVKSYTSTGRGSSKFFIGHKYFNELLEKGIYK